MKQRTVTLACEPGDARLLARAVRAYAHAAFPPGGSECAQVSREALLEAAAGIDAADVELVLRRRQLALLRTAVEWYFAESSETPEAAARLGQLLQKR